ncbi:hypothetical protein MHYP_G00339020 [Metynnis hypsauchen]
MQASTALEIQHTARQVSWLVTAAEEEKLDCVLKNETYKTCVEGVQSCTPKSTSSPGFLTHLLSALLTLLT